MTNLANSYPGNTCSPLDELAYAVERVGMCLAYQSRNGMAGTVAQQGGSPCEAFQIVSPCFEGLVDGLVNGAIGRLVHSLVGSGRRQGEGMVNNNIGY